MEWIRHEVAIFPSVRHFDEYRARPVSGGGNKLLVEGYGMPLPGKEFSKIVLFQEISIVAVFNFHNFFCDVKNEKVQEMEFAQKQ